MDLEQISGILKMNIFGSYSHHEHRPESDVDILVAFEKGATLFTHAGLINFLQDKIGIKVDVVSERAIKKVLRPYIEKDLIPV
jgi:hypothetical protein